MDYDFTPEAHTLNIPKNAYRQKIKCPHCFSFFVDNGQCESCGKKIQTQLDFSTHGFFSDKNIYTLKENYLRERTLLEKLFPESHLINKMFDRRKENSEYKRFLMMRLRDLHQLQKMGYLSDREMYLISFEADVVMTELFQFELNDRECERLLQEVESGIIHKVILKKISLQRSIDEVLSPKPFIKLYFFALIIILLSVFSAELFF